MSSNSHQQQLEDRNAVADLHSNDANGQSRQPDTASNDLGAVPHPGEDNGLSQHARPPSLRTSRAPLITTTGLHSNPSTHFLLLLSDSALPLGSFAFSSGLESYLAHHKPLPPTTTPTHSFQHFLHLSISTLASTAIPYVLTTYRHPDRIASLDDEFDASTPCTVARRASVAQGRALLSVWERALRPACDDHSRAASALGAFSALLKGAGADPAGLGANGHFAPLWALVCLSMGLPLSQTAYVFLFNHAKAVLSAAVRAGVMGPYQAQGFLASRGMQGRIEDCVNEQWEIRVEDAGQVVPMMDLWVGRHELLYSRIFNS